ncbi:D-Ala-D-Ala carboxypeptidase family metallohydrolase [Paenochrobactrum sp. BZR 588]|uniref:D-Ala-D-Ala carboxypeptidase family metallohydrolase n=1 Tax=unclassified Paenochrobactrum TaxID=2639760 RepID=UPI003851F8C8
MIANQKQTQKFFLYSSTCISLLAAFVLSACTATSSGSPAMQLSSTDDNSLVAEALQTAADEKIAEENAAKPATQAIEADKTDLADAKPEAKAETVALAALEPATETVAEKPVQKSTLVAALFATPKTSDAFKAVKPALNANAETTKPAETPKPQAAQITAPALPDKAEKPVVLASTLSKPSLELKKQPSAQSYNYSLPGVRAYGGLEIKHRNAVYDDSDIDADEDDDAPHLLRVSAPGLARLAPNGLKVQRESVDVACLKPELVKTLRKLESHFRKPVIVTSGYRSPSYNMKVKGARKSLHMTCAAADVQIEGVSKWEIARVARAMPSRGGVGTYCHTKSVHIDIGPERDWNWKCRGKS